MSPNPEVVQDRLMECGYSREEALRMIAASAAPRVMTLQIAESDQQALALGEDGRVRFAQQRWNSAARSFTDELMKLGLIVHTSERDDLRFQTTHRYSLRLA